MRIPDRNPYAQSGSEFCAALPSKKLDPVREEAILKEFLDYANVPDFYRSFVDVEVGDKNHSLIIRVAPDYLCVGTNDDYVRLPTNPITAQKIADAWECMLPTKKMVDRIYKASTVKLAPHPLPPTAKMTTIEWFAKSNEAIKGQLLKEESFVPGQLVGGHKKDVVITSKTFTTPKKVAIYGWHQKNGKPIQGPGVNSSSHEETYADYSHGIRLVDSLCVVDGVETLIGWVIRQPELCGYLSDEGPINDPRYRT